MRTKPIVFPVTKIKFGIVGAGFGAGLAMMGAAIIATQTPTLSERLGEEIQLLLFGLAIGSTLGWLMGPRPVAQRVRKAVWQPVHSRLDRPAIAWTPRRSRAKQTMSATLAAVTWPGARYLAPQHA